MNNENFLSALITFLKEQSGSETIDITANTELIENGIIDSFSITPLLLFIEERLGVSVEFEDLLLDSIKTARSIDTFFNVSGAAA